MSRRLGLALATAGVVGPLIALVPPGVAADRANTESGHAGHGHVGVENVTRPHTTLRAAKKRALRLERSAKGYNAGEKGVKVTARVNRSKGRVVFRVAGTKTSVKVKRGKASFRMPSSLTPGRYKVKAKLKGTRAKSSIKVRVWNTSITLACWLTPTPPRALTAPSTRRSRAA